MACDLERSSTPSSHVPLPAVAGAWAVEISVSGGVMGNGDGKMTVNSYGAVLCAARRICSTPSVTFVSTVNRIISSIHALDGIVSSRSDAQLRGDAMRLYHRRLRARSCRVRNRTPPSHQRALCHLVRARPAAFLGAFRRR